MSLVTELDDLTTRIATESKSLRTLINGNAATLNALTTTAKTNLVAAINELDAAIDALGSGGIDTLDELTDVANSAAAIGHILRHNGTNWVNVLGSTHFQPAAAALDNVVSHLTITQAVNLDTIEARVNALDAAVVLSGSWDASAGTFPGGGTAQAGQSWIVSTGGTVDGQVFVANDRIVAITDNASTGTYASNWLKLDYTDAVLSVAGQTGAVTASQILTALLAVDGAGSGLDADTVDGIQASAFALAADVGNTATDFVAIFEAGLV